MSPSIVRLDSILEMSSDKSFWTSLAGILTGIAAVITAIASLIGVLYHTDIASSDSPSEVTPKTEPTDSPPTITRPESKNEDSENIQDDSMNIDIDFGDAVLAKWTDGCLYPGVVRQVRHGSVFVHFDFGSQKWISVFDIVQPAVPAEFSLQVGVDVYVQIEDVRSRWVPSTIMDVRNEQYYMIFDEGAACAPMAAHTWADVGRIVIPK